MILHLLQNVRRQIKDGPLAWLLILVGWTVLLLVLFTVAMRYTEQIDWEEAIWQSWQTYTTVGYGNAPAETTWGRIATMVLATAGIAFVGALFSAAFDYKQYRQEQKISGKMENPHKNGYVIFNFPGTSTIRNLVDELRTVEQDVPICIVDSRLEELPSQIRNIPKIHFVSGDTLQKKTYENARVKDNKAIIVFPLDSSVAESDGATRTVVDLLGKFVDDKVRIMHILVSQDNEWMFNDVSSTEIMADLDVLALVQECQDEYSAKIVENLLLNTRGANPQTVKPNKIAGWTWEEFTMAASKTSRKLSTKCNPFALVKDGEPDTCPEPDSVINKDDRLSLIAYKGFDWEQFENALVK